MICAYTIQPAIKICITLNKREMNVINSSKKCWPLYFFNSFFSKNSKIFAATFLKLGSCFENKKMLCPSKRLESFMVLSACILDTLNPILPNNPRIRKTTRKLVKAKVSIREPDSKLVYKASAIKVTIMMLWVNRWGKSKAALLILVASFENHDNILP